MDDNMKDEMEGRDERRMQKWKMREEMLNAMSEKELRAFIKGYMMAERMMLKSMNQMCSDQGCRDDSCKGESCNCGDKECKDCK